MKISENSYPVLCLGVLWFILLSGGITWHIRNAWKRGMVLTIGSRWGKSAYASRDSESILYWWNLGGVGCARFVLYRWSGVGHWGLHREACRHVTRHLAKRLVLARPLLVGGGVPFSVLTSRRFWL